MNLRLSHKLLWLVMLALPVCSCSDDGQQQSPDLVPVLFTTGLHAVEASAGSILSRAANDTWDRNDQIGIYMVPALADADDEADFTQTGYPKNSNYETQAAGQNLPLYAVGNPILFPADINETVSFVAYYPYRATIHTQTVPHVYAVDISTQNPLTDIDLLFHKDTEEYSKADRSVTLEFTHQLSKLTITVTPGSDVTTDLSNAQAAYIGFPREATFDLSTGTLEIDENDLGNPSTSASPLLPVAAGEHTANEATFEAILIPHDGEDYTRTISIEANGTDYSYTLPSTISMEQGTAYSYNFTLTGRALILTGATIVPWNEESPADENIGESMPEGWDDDIDWETVVFDGESNCYIVPPSGQLLIPISRAYTYHADYDNNFPYLEPGEEFYTKVYWSDNANTLTAKDETTASTQITTIGTGPNGYILVRPGNQPGNAIVALQKKNADQVTYTTLWSWHVWVTTYNPNTPGSSWVNTYNTNNNGNHFTFMDRNLGATFAGLGSGLGTGLFYQWGRKDPFPATLEADDPQPGGGSFTAAANDAINYTQASTINNPATVLTGAPTWPMPGNNHELWGHGNTTPKTLFDPCPAGWRIPSCNIAANAVATDASSSPWYGLENRYTFESLGVVFDGYAQYPFTGRRIDSVLHGVGEGLSGVWTASPHTIYFPQTCVRLWMHDGLNIYDPGWVYQGNSVRCVRES